MKKITVLTAAVLAVAPVLAAGLTVLPSSTQEAQANPCANEVTDSGTTTGSLNPRAMTNANVNSPAISNLMKTKHQIAS
jgi:hypothetical protein